MLKILLLAIKKNWEILLKKTPTVLRSNWCNRDHDIFIYIPLFGIYVYMYIKISFKVSCWWKSEFRPEDHMTPDLTLEDHMISIVYHMTFMAYLSTWQQREYVYVIIVEIRLRHDHHITSIETNLIKANQLNMFLKTLTIYNV